MEKDLQMKFTEILKSKGKKVKGLSSMQLLRNWDIGIHSPKLTDFEDLCKENDIDFFISDGSVETLIAYVNKIGEKKGFKATFTF